MFDIVNKLFGIVQLVRALDVKLTDAHLAALAEAFPPGAAAGGRYPEEHLRHMDSEKPAAAS
ncbi:hypothetical protein ABIB82_005020 [Bradyrhizobium sp. i1.8.4]|uniref:hypothetical protein n=1 Tax=unclassified Bradyrhizobium TaxID=2631580 RepID=UPI003D1E46EB